MTALTTRPLPDGQLADAETVLRHLSALRVEHGHVPAAVLDYWADLAGRKRRTLQHWLTLGAAPTYKRPAFTLDDRYKQLYFDCRGNVSKVRRKAEKAGLEPPSRETLARAFHREVSPFERAFAGGGDGNARKHNLVLHAEPEPHKWHTQQADHFRLDVLVVPPRSTKPTYLYLTVCEDTTSRYVNVVASRHPDQSTVLAVMRKVVQPDPETGVGGIPERWVWDNGLEFLSNAVTRAALTLDSLPLPTDYYAPWQKGKVERFGRTLTEELLGDLPGWSKGPRTRDGKVYLPRDGALPEETFLAILDERIRCYNTERPHSALGGMTPLEAYHADPTPVRQATEEQLRSISLPAEERTILADGIRFDAERYWAPELDGLVGEKVIVGHIPGEKRWVEVWRNGVFLCVAIHETLAGEDDKQRLLASRRQLSKQTKQNVLDSLERADLNAKRYGFRVDDAEPESPPTRNRPPQRKRRTTHATKPRLDSPARPRGHVLPAKRPRS